MASLQKSTCTFLTSAPRTSIRSTPTGVARASLTSGSRVVSPSKTNARGVFGKKNEFASLRQAQVVNAVTTYLPPVDELAAQIEADDTLSLAFDLAVESARIPGVELVDRLITSTQSYLEFADFLLRTPPFQNGNSRNCYQALSLFYFILSQPSLKALQSPIEPGPPLPRDELTWLSQWIITYAEAWGAFMNTPESAADIDTFMDNAYYNWNDYIIPDGGFKTFNDYFCRHVKPELRPIASPNDDSIITNPADCAFVGWWNIDSDSTIFSQELLAVKGVEWSIRQLLDDSQYSDRFAGGIFMHSFLNTYNYHRWHSPVRGRVKELRVIEGQCYLDVNVMPNFDGKKQVKVLNALDQTGYQFVQTRGLCIIDSPIGMVACLPMGMAQVSSVVFTVNEGDMIAKGEELGYFLFGGSDFVMVFENRAQLQLLLMKNTQGLVGQAIGKAYGPTTEPQ